LEGFLGNVERYAMAKLRSKYVPSVAAEAAPYGVDLVEQEARDKPLKAWWDMFPSQREQLTHVHAVRYFYLGFKVHAAKLDQALHIWARQFLNFKGIGPDPEMERAIARYALAKLLGVDQELAVY
jgi:hypothetical protein